MPEYTHWVPMTPYRSSAGTCSGQRWNSGRALRRGRLHWQRLRQSPARALALGARCCGLRLLVWWRLIIGARGDDLAGDQQLGQPRQFPAACPLALLASATAANTMLEHAVQREQVCEGLGTRRRGLPTSSTRMGSPTHSTICSPSAGWQEPRSRSPASRCSPACCGGRPPRRCAGSAS